MKQQNPVLSKHRPPHCKLITQLEQHRTQLRREAHIGLGRSSQALMQAKQAQGKQGGKQPAGKQGPTKTKQYAGKRGASAPGGKRGVKPGPAGAKRGKPLRVPGAREG